MRQNGPKERIWVTEFSDVALQKFYAEFMEMESDPFVDIIPVVVSSYGGNLDNMLAMRDVIKSSQKSVSVTAVGKAMSAGSALLASGTKGLRFVGANVNIMIHEASSVSWGKTEEMKTATKNTEDRNELFLKYMAEDMGKPISWLKNQIHRRKNADWYLTAEEAIKIGLADSIGVPRTYMAPPHQVIQVDINDEGLKRKKGKIKAKNLLTKKDQKGIVN